MSNCRSGKAVLCLILLLCNWGRVSHAEPGMDIMYLHSVKALATTGTLDAGEVSLLLTAFKVITTVSALSPPTSKIGVLTSAVSLGQEIADGDEASRRLGLCRDVPQAELVDCSLNATIFSDAVDYVDQVLDVYNTLNAVDSLLIFAGTTPISLLAQVLDDKIFDQDITARETIDLFNTQVHFSNKEGINLTLFEEDDNVFDSTNDLISSLNFRYMEAQSNTELRIVSPDTGASYVFKFSIGKDQGRFSEMGPKAQSISGLEEPNPLTVQWNSSEYSVSLINSDSGTDRGFSNTGQRTITSMSTPYRPTGWGVTFDEGNEVFSLKFSVTSEPGFIPVLDERTEGCRWMPADRGPGLGATREYWGFASQACTVTLKALRDSDEDGVVDTSDLCPETEPRQSGDGLDGNGCAAKQRDTDGDSVNDAIDQCGTTPVGARINGVGCADRDGDSTADSDDAFPDDALEDTDTDGDGTGDNSDDFPNAVSALEQAYGIGSSVSVLAMPRVGTSSCSLNSVEVEPFSSPRGMRSLAFQVGFVLEGCATGEAVDVSIDFGERLPDGARIYKVDGSGMVQHISSALINGSIATYELIDNGPLDTNPDDGAIADPVTMMVVLTVPTMQSWLLFVLGALLMLLGVRKLRVA